LTAFLEDPDSFAVC